MGTTRKATEVVKALTAKGMTLRGTHHKMLTLQINGVTTIHTRVSHGTNQIGAPLIAQMARQCELSKAEFLELVDCTLSAERWHALVAERSST